MTNRTVVRLRPGCSDGDALHVPKQGQYNQVNPPTLYLEKIGQQWMQNRGDVKPGVKYILESLPAGYTMWERPRPSDPKHIDRYLYGHPGNKFFDSPNRFYPHFEYLMNNGNNIGCNCTLCAGSSGILPNSRSSSSRASSTLSSGPLTSKGSGPSSGKRPGRSAVPPIPPPPQESSVGLSSISSVPLPTSQVKGRPKLVSTGADASRVDEEGTPDVYRNLIDKLRRHNIIDEKIEEPLSPDWLAEQKMLPNLLTTLKDQPQWIPRTGDVVLFVRDVPSGTDFVRHETTGEIRLYNEETGQFVGPPRWEAGLVTETPVGSSAITDLYELGNVNPIYSGVRVEPLPDSISMDKSLSKRHKYIALRQTRPFILWKELLQTPQEEWHPSIIHALTITSTLSLMGKYRFRGTWPEASIYCYGLYIGTEMLVIGDTVRLSPNTKNGQVVCADVLLIKSIRLKWSNLDKASTNDYDEGRPYNSEVWVYGVGYTSDSTRSYAKDDGVTPPRAANAYCEWYALHPPEKELAVPYSRILGRLHEREAMAFWLNTEHGGHPDLDVGREILMESRLLARQRDRRIANEPDATWYWADSRADALNIYTINGLETARFDQERNMRERRKEIKLVQAAEASKPDVKPESQRLRQFMAPGTSLPDRQRITSSSDASKRPFPTTNDVDEEDEIRQNTKVVNETPGIAKKKPKVLVVID